MAHRETARIPGGIDGGRPAPDSRGASLLSVSGSFSSTAAIKPRLSTSFVVENAPATGLLDGQATSFTSLSVTREPFGRLLAATTM